MSEKELLQFALANGIIDLEAIHAQIEMNERKRFLEEHKNKIWQGKNGQWYTELPARQDKKRRLVKKKNLEDLEEEIINFYRTAEEHPTFKQLYNEWIATKLEWEEIGQGTADRYNVDYNKFIKGTDLENLRIDYLTEEDLEDFIKKSIAQNKLTAKAYSGLKTIMLGVLKFAKKRKYTKISPSSFFGDLQISKKSYKAPEKKKQVFTEAEAKKINDYLNENRKLENLGILLAFQTGIRMGELTALKYSDIEGDYLHIQRQQIKYKQDGQIVYKIVEFTKSEAGDRHVVLTDKAKKIIRQLRRINTFGEYIFIKNGEVIKKDRFNDYLYLACEKTGTPRMSMHKIRKTYGTMLINSGADDSTIQEQMGHSDITTTRKYYYFSNKGQEEKAEQVKKAIII